MTSLKERKPSQLGSFSSVVNRLYELQFNFLVRWLKSQQEKQQVLANAAVEDGGDGDGNNSS